MSGQRARPAIPVDQRSAHPGIPGVPWWGAILIAVVGTAIGFAFDAGSGAGQLTSVFSVLYAMGCLTAVLAVQRAGVFTAVIQPPLILFVVVPGAYFMMHSAEIHGLKDLLINCGYPLIERFPLMFFTSAIVLLTGVVRWYLARAAGGEARSGLSAKLTSLLTGSAGSAAEQPGRRNEGSRRPPRTAKPERPPRTTKPERAARSKRTTKSTTPPRPRHTRPPETEIIEPIPDLGRPRRRRPPTAEQPPESRRRSRASTRDTQRSAAPPGERRSTYDRPERPRAPRRPRYDGYERYDGYQPLDAPHNGQLGGPLEPRAAAPNGTHHPISRVRYRGDDSDRRSEQQRRNPRGVDADRWEYDI